MSIKITMGDKTYEPAEGVGINVEQDDMLTNNVLVYSLSGGLIAEKRFPKIDPTLAEAWLVEGGWVRLLYTTHEKKFDRWKYAEEAAHDLVRKKIPFTLTVAYDVAHEDDGETYTYDDFILSWQVQA